MIAMISKSYRKNKSVFWIPIAFILVLSVVMFSLNVSSQVETKQYVHFHNQKWEIGQKFSNEWFMNGDSLDFQVNLSEDYKHYLKPKEGEEEPPVAGDLPKGGVPFNVNVKGPGSVKITPITDGGFKGLYNVSITGIHKDGKIPVDFNFKNDTWVNEPPTNQTEFFVINDKKAPVVKLTGPKDREFYQRTVNLAIEVIDENFVQNKVNISIKKDGMDYKLPKPVVWNGNKTSIAFDQAGHYEIEVKATDKAGNVSEANTISFGNVSTDARLYIQNQTNNHFYKNNVNIVIENPLFIHSAKLTYIKDGGEPQTVDMNIENRLFVKKATYSLTEEGTYEISANITDMWRTTDFGPYKNIKIDKTPPKLSITGVENGKRYKESKVLEFSATDTYLDESKSVLKLTKNGKVETITGKKALEKRTLTDGIYTVELSVFDKAGNETKSPKLHFTIDTKKPVLSISGIANGKFYPKEQTVHFSVEDLTLDMANTTLVVKHNNSDYKEKIKLKKNGTKAEASHTFTNDGKYTIELSATDQLGHEAEKITRSFTIDKAKPEIDITGIDKDGRYNDDRDVTITITELNMRTSNVTVKHNGEPYEIDPLELEGKTATTQHTFTEEGVYELQVQSTDKAGNVGSENMKFTVDKNGPVITYSIEDGTYFKDEKVNLTVTVDDYTPFVPELTVNNEVLKDNWVQKVNWLITQKLTISFEDEGVYSVQVKAKDYFGAESKKNLRFTIDRTAPEIEISGNIPNEGFVKGNNELIIDIHDLHFDESNNEVLVNGKAVDAEWKKTATGYQFKQSFPKDGKYEVKVRSEDFAGNKSALKTHNFTVDNVKPVITIENVKNGTFYDKKRTATIKVHELNFANNKVNIEVTKNNAPYPFDTWKNKGVESSLAIPFHEDGDYVIKVSAKDAAGNAADAQQVKLTIDETFPELNITGVEHMTNYNVSKRVSFEVTDANIDQTSLRVTKDGKNYDVGTFKQTRTNAILQHHFTEEGSYVLYFNATDKSGNKTTHDEIAFIIDKTSPVVKIDGVDHQSFNPTGKRITVSVDELNFGSNEVVLVATKDGKAFNIGTWRNDSKLSSLSYNFKDDGLYTIAISAKDKAGNGPVTANKTFTIDTTKPTIEITGVENNAHYNVDKSVSVEIRDVNLDVNRITVTRNGREYHAGGVAVSNQIASLRHNFSQEGDYVISVEAIDKAGNQFSKQMAFTIDKTAPVITPKFKGQNRVIKDGEYINEVFTPEFALDQAEDTIVSVTMNGKNVTGRIPTASLEMKYEFSVLARDKAGNESTINIHFILDTTRPNLSITGVIDGFFNKNKAPNVTYSDRNLDTSRSTVTLNGRPFENGVELSEERDYILKADIYDLANNVSSRTIVFTIDKTAPVITFKEPISDRYFNESLIPELLIEDLNDYDIISLTLNGQPYNLGAPIEEEGKHVLFFEVKDKAGNIQQLSVEFIIDKTPPNIIIDGVEKNETYRDPVTLSISLDNPSDTLKSVMINGELFNGEIKEVNGTKTISVTLSDINTYKVEVVAFDEAGNESNEIIEFEIVEKSVFVKLYENKPLFAGTLAGLVGAAAAGAVALRRSIIRKRDEKDM